MEKLFSYTHPFPAVSVMSILIIITILNREREEQIKKSEDTI